MIRKKIGLLQCRIHPHPTPFSFMLEKYIFAGACGLRSPLFESSSVSYITPTWTSSMQELMMQGMQQLFEKSCFRCEKYTWHVESNHILQPPIYLIVIARRFRFIGKHFVVDLAVLLGPPKFSLQTTLDHHGPSMYFGHYTSYINCCQKNLLQPHKNYGVSNDWYQNPIYCVRVK